MVMVRSATDAAARAAGEGLSRAQDVDYARQAAKDIAAANHVAGQPLLLDDSDVVFGKSSQQADGAWAFTPGGEPINAVRVFGRRTREAPSGSVPIFFGRVFNVLDFQPTQAATVVRLDRDICLVVRPAVHRRAGDHAADRVRRARVVWQHVHRLQLFEQRLRHQLQFERKPCRGHVGHVDALVQEV
jgi:hypothetical protein